MTKVKIERVKPEVAVTKPEAGQFRSNSKGELVLVVEHGDGLNVVLLNYAIGDEEYDAFLQYSDVRDCTIGEISDEYPTVISAKVVIS